MIDRKWYGNKSEKFEQAMPVMTNPARKLMMLNLKLRDEFLGSQMPGTAIALRRKDNTGAAQRTRDFILSITYPTADVQTALRAVSTDRSKRPIVLMGDRGRGKSHIMAVMHHAVESSTQVQKWANEWGNRLGEQPLSGLVLDGGFFAISEPVHNHEYPLLWDLIFERHPRGDFFRGKFNSKQAVFERGNRSGGHREAARDFRRSPVQEGK